MLKLLDLMLDRNTSSFTREEEAVVGKDYSGDPPRGFSLDAGAAIVSYITSDGAMVERKRLWPGYHPVRVARFTFISTSPATDEPPKVWVGW